MRIEMTLTTRVILEAIIRSSDVNYNGGTITSKIATYSRIDHLRLNRKYLPVLVAQGLISKEEKVAQDNNPRRHSSSRIFEKKRSSKTPNTIYRITPRGHEWLMNNINDNKTSIEHITS